MPLDNYGYHALTCKKLGEKVRRHDAIKNIINSHAMNSRMNPVLEKPNLDIYNEKEKVSKKRPADIFLLNVSLNENFWIDVAVTDPRQPLFFDKSLANPNHAVDAYTQTKHDNCLQNWNNENEGIRKARFVPVVADAFGNWSKGAVDLFDIILKRDPERSEISYPIRKNFFNFRNYLFLFRDITHVLF